MDNYVIYLRKSRADMDAELRGEGETLARHEKMLLELAQKMNLSVGNIYKEIVSGETIAARPMVQRLLQEVEQGMWKGVLVMEVERLARGSTIDQGIIAQAFSFSGTKIITPIKTYDPNNEFDEEYFEFGLFMSRREYKTINRRIQRGRLASIHEGKYISSVPPYGYDRIKLENDKGYSLKPNKEQAEVVKLIYSLYTEGLLQSDGTYKLLGTYAIARYLDSLGVKSQKGNLWSPASIKDILKNPVYIGKICWQRRKEITIIENGIKKKTRPNAKDYILVDGLHEGIINPELFNLAQKIIGTKAPVKNSSTLHNPLSGLIHCKKCGKMLTRLAANTKTKYDTLKCPNIYCDNISAPLAIVEENVLIALKEWIETYRVEEYSSVKNNTEKLKQTQLLKSEKELKKLQEQKDRIYTLLEQGIYSTEEFLSRSKSVSKNISELETQIKILQMELKETQEQNTIYSNIIPKTKQLLAVYHTLPDVTQKNIMLKEIIEKVYYLKTERNKKGAKDTANFIIELFPRLPK